MQLLAVPGRASDIYEDNKVKHRVVVLRRRRCPRGRDRRCHRAVTAAVCTQPFGVLKGNQGVGTRLEGVGGGRWGGVGVGSVALVGIVVVCRQLVARHVWRSRGVFALRTILHPPDACRCSSPLTGLRGSESDRMGMLEESPIQKARVVAEIAIPLQTLWPEVVKGKRKAGVLGGRSNEVARRALIVRLTGR